MGRPAKKRQVRRAAKGAKALQATPSIIWENTPDFNALVDAIWRRAKTGLDAPLARDPCSFDNGGAKGTRLPPPAGQSLGNATTIKPPFKVRLEQINQALLEHLNVQQGFINYLSPQPADNSVSSATPSSMEDLFDSIEYLLMRNSSVFSDIRNQF